MGRIFLLLAAGALLFACSKEPSDAQRRSAAGVGEGEAVSREKPRAAIPDEGEGGLAGLVKGRLVPYFDAQGSIGSIEVAPGEQFPVYVFAEFDEAYPTSAAEYMLELPPGVEMLYEVKSDSVIITMGSYDEDFMLSFKCLQGPRSWIMKYVCKAGEDFEGGKVRTAPGKLQNFMGFTLCDVERTLVKAEGGEALLSRK